MLSLVKRALVANSVSKSIYTSNMIKGGGQGGLKRKNYWSKYLWLKVAPVYTSVFYEGKQLWRLLFVSLNDEALVVFQFS